MNHSSGDPSSNKEAAPLRRWRLRFSLRFLLAMMAVASVLLVWGILPTLHARRYVAAINSGDYEQATSLCLDPQRAYPGDRNNHTHFDPKARISPVTWNDVWRGQRQVFIMVTYGDGGGLASYGVECVATRRGIEVGVLMP